MKRIGLLLMVIILLSIVHSSLGIWCFSCSSRADPECATLKQNDTASPFYINCTKPEHTFCRTTTVTIVDSNKYVRVTRSCGYIQYKAAVDNCYESDDAFKFEKSCQCFTDGCNSSSTIQASILVTAAALTLIWHQIIH